MENNEYDLSDPSDIRRELALLRKLTSESTGNPGLQKSLVDSITRAAGEYHRQQVRKNNYLHIEAVKRWGELFVARVNEELGTLPEETQIQIVDNLMKWLADPANAPGNTDQEVAGLIGRQR